MAAILVFPVENKNKNKFRVYLQSATELQDCKQYGSGAGWQVLTDMDLLISKFVQTESPSSDDNQGKCL